MILADEPTAALDSETGRMIADRRCSSLPAILESSSSPIR